MSNVYSRRFAALTGFAGDYDVVVPAGFIAVLRDLDCYYAGAPACTIRLIGEVGQTIWWHQFGALNTGEYASWRGRQVIGEGVLWKITADNASDVTVSGYLLSLP